MVIVNGMGDQKQHHAVRQLDGLPTLFTALDPLRLTPNIGPETSTAGRHGGRIFGRKRIGHKLLDQHTVSYQH